jgi:hypothetical protein
MKEVHLVVATLKAVPSTQEVESMTTGERWYHGVPTPTENLIESAHATLESAQAEVDRLTSVFVGDKYTYSVCTMSL